MFLVFFEFFAFDEFLLKASPKVSAISFLVVAFVSAPPLKF